MSEPGSDWSPPPWGDRDGNFDDARRAYDAHAGRSYDSARAKGLGAPDLVPDRLVTEAISPSVIELDGTGSMGDWFGVICGKLPYLAHEAEWYFGKGCPAIAFGAFADAHNNDDYPFQHRPFSMGPELEGHIKELVRQPRAGGGGIEESSELAALYALNNIEMPNAHRPIMIIITDEQCYPKITPDHAKHWAKVSLGQEVTTREVFAQLQSRWAVYVILKPYGTDSDHSENHEDSKSRQVRLFWESMVGVDHVAHLPVAERVVDVIFGIWGAETGKVEEFRQELRNRQLKDAGGAKKVQVVLNALKTIHHAHDAAVLGRNPSLRKLPGPADGQLSMTRRDDPDADAPRSIALLGGSDDET